jgi:hypothetical protein
MKVKSKNIRYLIYKRGLLIFLSIASIFIAVLIKLELSSIGFPDGAKTEFDRLNKIIFPIYIVIYILFSTLFLYLGYNLKNITTQRNAKWIIIAFLIFIALMFATNHYFYLNFDHGQGG